MAPSANNPPGDHWDADRAISEALFLSHFVHGHSVGFEFAARIELDNDDRITRLAPAEIELAFVRAYPARGSQRLWLTQEDGELLAGLITRYGEARRYLRDKRLGLAISLFSQVYLYSWYGRELRF